MSDNDPGSVRAPVVLRCSTVAGGRQIAAVQEIPRASWDDADDAMKEHFIELVRLGLESTVMRETGHAIVAAALPVQAHIPGELEDQLHREALAQASDS